MSAFFPPLPRFLFRGLLGVDPSAPTKRSVYGVPLYSTPAVDTATIWGVPEAKAFVVMRTDASLAVDTSAYFSSDRTGVRCTLRVGFGFPHEKKKRSSRSASAAARPMSRTSDRGYQRRRARLKRSADGDVCWHCSRPIDMDLKWPDPGAWTADHVEPVSRGGHNRGLILTAHWLCNQRRGAGRDVRPVRHGRQW